MAEISCFKAEKPKMNEKLKWILVKGGGNVVPLIRPLNSVL